MKCVRNVKTHENVDKVNFAPERFRKYVRRTLKGHAPCCFLGECFTLCCRLKPFVDEEITKV